MALGDKIKALLGKHGDKIDKAIEKAGDMADRKTGGKYSEKIDAAQRQAKRAAGDAARRPGDAGTTGPAGTEPPA